MVWLLLVCHCMACGGCDAGCGLYLAGSFGCYLGCLVLVFVVVRVCQLFFVCIPIWLWLLGDLLLLALVVVLPVYLVFAVVIGCSVYVVLYCYSMCLLSLLCCSSLLLSVIVVGWFASCMLHVPVLCVFMMDLYYD